MNPIPFRTVRLASDLPPAVLVELLRGAVGDVAAAPFAGSVGADGFVISRMSAYRSTNLPLLRGRVAPGQGEGSRVLLSLRPPAVVLVFMAIWLGFLAAAAGLIVAAHALHPDRSLLLLLGPGGLAAVSWAVMASVFAADAHWAVRHLLEQLPALRTDPGGAAPGTSTPSAASMVRDRSVND